MRIMLVFAFIALVMTETVTAFDETCDLKELEDCVTESLRYFLNQFVKFNTLPEELESTCEEFMKNATCATSQPKHCKDRYPKLQNLLGAIEKYSSRFCRNSEERKLYLEQAPCLDQYRESFQECMKPNRKETHGETTITYGCKSLKEMLVCVNETGKKCGEPAEKLMEYLMEPIQDVYPVFTTSLKRAWMNLFGCVSTESTDVRDTTIVCVFQNIKKCYKAVGKLGADPTVELPKTEKELQEICSGNMVENFSDCMNDVVWTCNTDIGMALNIRSDVEGYCRGGPEYLRIYQRAFLNSTECYNSYVPKIKECHDKYATNQSDDAKTLCYSAFKIKECTNFLTNLCSKNVTVVPKRNYTQILPAANLVHKYYEYADAVCMKYYNRFNSAFAILPSTIWMVTAVSLLIFKINHYKL